MSPGSDERRAQLAANLAAVRAQIERACERAGRSPGEVTLIAVTKTFPADDVRLLAELGVRDFGENRHQEAQQKVAEVADPKLTWHFVGQLQANKARAVAEYAAVVHSVDRVRLVGALRRAAAGREQPLRCLVQVDLGDAAQPGAGGRGGVPPDQVAEVADAVAAAPELVLGGVMAVAPLGTPPAPAFARLAETAAEVRTKHPEATWVSAGMSADLEDAIAHGATHVRLGRRLLGERGNDR
ncbi:YggS family pyridoxal phosphate-dependent enzyme [Actinopolymorpha sp. NPDC004070]|uniref:YggS family pyridoxal phosphate-dependent enzyme n=1 Tax=Actinopolymorpha sp. NPDC004070 TaxID=3154548 RepID=UPI0033AA607F